MTDAWFPALGDAETRPADQHQQAPLLLNADLEPDADGDGYGDETQDGCPTEVSTQGECAPPPLPAMPLL